MSSKWLQLQRLEFGRWVYFAQSFIFPLVVAILAVFEIWAPSLILLLVGKWRSVMFPPRFWPVTFRKAIVDLSVGGAYVLLQWRLLSPLYSPQFTEYLIACAVAGFYLLWLVSIRHKETMSWHRVQGLIALASGYLTVDSLLASQPVVVKVAFLFVVFYTSYRHLFFSVKEGLEHLRAVIWALIALQFWIILDRYYIDSGIGNGLNISLASAFTAAFYLLSSYIYDERHRSGVKYYGLGLVVVAATLVIVIRFGG